MGYDPSEPRDRSGKWAGGAARGHNAGKGNRSLVDRISTQHQRDTALAIGKGALVGAAEGIVAGAVIGAATGGFGVAPALIARGIASGVAAGVRHSSAHVVLGAVGGGLSAYQARMKSAIKQQHKKG